MNAPRTFRTSRTVALAAAPVLLLASLGAATFSCGGSQTTQQTTVAPTPTPEPTPTPAPQPEPAQTPDAPFRQAAPEPGPPPAFTPPAIQDFALHNGIRVLLVERHDVPIVVAEYITRRGGDDVPPAKAGLGSLVGALLESGTTTHDALALSDAFENIGADHGSWSAWDSGGAQVKVASPNFAQALALLAEVVQHPAFAPDELERARARRLGAIAQELDVPARVAANVSVRVLYGDAHPYGHSLLGTAETIHSITRDDVTRYYASHFVPNDGAIVVVGDVTRDALAPQLETTFGAWRVARAGHASPAPGAAPAHTGPRLILVDKPGATQSQITILNNGVPRTAPDYPAVLVMNAILGGMFSSRINMNLREAHAYTYGASSGFAMRHGAGPFSAGAPVFTAVTGPALREVFNELTRIRSDEVSEEELTLAKSRLAQSLPARFETNDSTAALVGDLFTYGLPLDEYATYASRIGAVTAGQVRSVAQAHLDPEHALVVVVGDRSQIESELAGLDLGPIEVRDAQGNVVGGTPGAGSGTAGSSGAGTNAPSGNAAAGGEHHGEHHGHHGGANEHTEGGHPGHAGAGTGGGGEHHHHHHDAGGGAHH